MAEETKDPVRIFPKMMLIGLTITGVCVYLASPLSGRASADYKIAGWLMLVGVGLWAVTWLLNKYVFKRHAEFDPTHIDPSGPVN